MPIKMKELPETERPYEKLEKYGEKRLTNAELIAIIIKTGTKEETSIGLAHKILKLNECEEKGLNFLRELSIEELMKIKGIGKVKAIQLKAVCELSSRMNQDINYKTTKITSPKDVANILMDKMRFEKQEILQTIMLDNRNNIIKIKEIAKGTGNYVKASIKSILSEAIKIEAPKIILVHNHPGGDPTPSEKDIEFTRKVKNASEMVGIELIDHVVIGRVQYKSIFSRKFLRNERKEL